MALQTFLPAIPPSPGTTIVPKMKILQADFGDGYQQRAADGINHVRETYSFVWEEIAASDANDIIGFLNAHGGVLAFLYTPPGETVPRKFISQDYSRTRARFSSHAIAAKFIVVYDPD